MIKLIADSTCNLDQAILDKYNISIVPLLITIGDQTYIDGEGITPNELYGKLASLEKLPTTGVPSPDVIVDMYKQCAADGYDEILFITMSSGTSGIYQVSELAKDMYYSENPDSHVRIHVIDSLSMSQGTGLLIMKSAMMLENGASLDEVIEFNHQYRKHVKHYLSVDDLDNLIKSGRLSNTSAQIGKLLHIKPIMTMKKSKGVIESKVRGRKKVLNYYITQLDKRIDREMTNFIIIGYTSDITFAQNLKKMIEESQVFNGDIYIMQMGCVVGTHVGLGGLSMFFIEKPKSHWDLYHEMKEKASNLIHSKIDK